MKLFALAVAVLLIVSPVLAQHQGHHPAPAANQGGQAQPHEPGQSAFAAIQEIVALLEADPRTDWSKVDIEALRRHLIDMSNVTLSSQIVAEPVERGARYTVTGVGPDRESIRRMVTAHAATMSGQDGWRFVAAEYPDGATLSVTVDDPRDLPKLRALGFIGVMTRGMHHQAHHLMIARGQGPHH